MPGHVREIERRRADELHGRCLEQPVVLLAHESRVLDGLVHDVMHVRIRADDADVVWMWLESVKSDV